VATCLNRFSGVHHDINKHNTISYRAFKHLKIKEFQNELMNTDFSLIKMQNNVDMSLKLFYDLINGMLSKRAPMMKQKHVSHPTQPGWFNEDINKSYVTERDQCPEGALTQNLRLTVPNKNTHILQYRSITNLEEFKKFTF